MQLNIHVPKDREEVVAELEVEAEASGRPKNQIVLDALTAYLHPHQRRAPRLRAWDLGAPAEISRADLYAERLDAKLGGPE